VEAVTFIRVDSWLVVAALASEWYESIIVCFVISHLNGTLLTIWKSVKAV